MLRNFVISNEASRSREVISCYNKQISLTGSQDPDDKKTKSVLATK